MSQIIVTDVRVARLRFGPKWGHCEMIAIVMDGNAYLLPPEQAKAIAMEIVTNADNDYATLLAKAMEAKERAEMERMATEVLKGPLEHE